MLLRQCAERGKLFFEWHKAKPTGYSSHGRWEIPALIPNLWPDLNVPPKAYKALSHETLRT